MDTKLPDPNTKPHKQFRTAMIVTLEDGKDFICDYLVQKEDEDTVTVVSYRPEKPFDKFVRITVTKKRTIDFPRLIEVY